MNFDLKASTVYLVLAGSRAYGTNQEGSDWDYRGVAIPPMESYIGVRYKFEQAVDKKISDLFPGLVEPDSDIQIAEITKFVKLALVCNPSVIELLFTKNALYVHPSFQKLLDVRSEFLSKQAKARFYGYAISQLEKIKRHKRWIDSPPQNKPNRSDFGLPEFTVLPQDQLNAAEELIRKEADRFVITQDNLSEDTKINLSNELRLMLTKIWQGINADKPLPIGSNQVFYTEVDAIKEAVMKEQGFHDNFIEILRKERAYRQAKQHWDSYQIWLKERNPIRAELERKYGYDCKNGMHLYRSLTAAREILENCNLTVEREDRQVLLDIRNGAWSYEEICDFAEKEGIALEELMKTSKLPTRPNINKINEITQEIIMEFEYERKNK